MTRIVYWLNAVEGVFLEIGGSHSGNIGQQTAIRGGRPATFAVPHFHVGKLHPEHGGLNLIHASLNRPFVESRRSAPCVRSFRAIPSDVVVVGR